MKKIDLRELVQPVVWIIDAGQWPRAMLRAQLIENGLDAIGFEHLDQALHALQNPLSASAREPDLIVLQLHGQATPTRDQLDKLANSGARVLLLGSALDLKDPPLPEFSWPALQRPYTLGDVAREVQRLLKH